MTKFNFIEEIFQHFYRTVVVHQACNFAARDYNAAVSFSMTIAQGKLLTDNQRRYILNILERHRHLILDPEFDYTDHLAHPYWKNPARIIDLSKKVWVEKINDTVSLCFKFPFSVKADFEKVIDQNYKTYWDPDRYARVVPLYSTDLLAVNEFIENYRFNIDETYSAVLAQWEEIVQQESSIVPASTIVDQQVELINAAPAATEYWQQNRTNRLAQDLLLAKSIGHRLVDTPYDTVSTIAATDDLYWTDDFDLFFQLYQQITGKVCVLLDRAVGSRQWIEQFLAAADRADIARDRIKVCFRERKQATETGFNQWIKEQNLTGKVDDADIVIFQNKPAKWLLKQQESVIMLVTNNIFPPTNKMTYDWLDRHCCSIFLGETKPSPLRDRKIVKL